MGEINSKEGERTEAATEGQLMCEEMLFEEIGRISSELSHDLRGTLQIIRNCTYLLKMDPGDESVIDQIDGAVKQATTILDDFREYYTSHEVNVIDAKLNSIVEQALIGVEIPQGIKVKAALDQVIDGFSIDPIKMKRVFTHLIRSAVDAMPDGGTLTIETQDTPDAVKILVTDTGEPIPEDIREDLLKPYGSRSRDGNGLSLPSCKRVVEAHGGELSLDSSGDGTTFTIVLPKGDSG